MANVMQQGQKEKIKTMIEMFQKILSENKKGTQGNDMGIGGDNKTGNGCPDRSNHAPCVNCSCKQDSGVT